MLLTPVQYENMKAQLQRIIDAYGIEEVLEAMKYLEIYYKS